MGNGISILVWDSYGQGLVRVNPRLIINGKDCYDNDCNWFPYKSKEEKEKLISELTKGYAHFKVIE